MGVVSVVAVVLVVLCGVEFVAERAGAVIVIGLVEPHPAAASAKMARLGMAERLHANPKLMRSAVAWCSSVLVTVRRDASRSVSARRLPDDG